MMSVWYTAAALSHADSVLSAETHLEASLFGRSTCPTDPLGNCPGDLQDGPVLHLTEHCCSTCLICLRAIQGCICTWLALRV
jgi:hypothetical protein